MPSFGTPMSKATTGNPNRATSLSGIADSPLEYAPASRSPPRSLARNERGLRSGVTRACSDAENCPGVFGLIDGGTKNAVVIAGSGRGGEKRRTSMNGLRSTVLKSTARMFSARNWAAASLTRSPRTKASGVIPCWASQTEI